MEKKFFFLIIFKIKIGGCPSGKESLGKCLSEKVIRENGVGEMTGNLNYHIVLKISWLLRGFLLVIEMYYQVEAYWL